MSFVERFITLCPYLGEPTIRGSTVDIYCVQTVLWTSTTEVLILGRIIQTLLCVQLEGPLLEAVLSHTSALFTEEVHAHKASHHRN